jgi:hypothetical protein
VVSVDAIGIANYCLPAKIGYGGRGQTILHQMNKFKSNSAEVDRWVQDHCAEQNIPYFKLQPTLPFELRLDVFDESTSKCEFCYCSNIGDIVVK